MPGVGRRLKGFLEVIKKLDARAGRATRDWMPDHRVSFRGVLVALGVVLGSSLVLAAVSVVYGFSATEGAQIGGLFAAIFLPALTVGMIAMAALDFVRRPPPATGLGWFAHLIARVTVLAMGAIEVSLALLALGFASWNLTANYSKEAILFAVSALLLAGFLPHGLQTAWTALRPRRSAR